MQRVEGQILTLFAFLFFHGHQKYILQPTSNFILSFNTQWRLSFTGESNVILFQKQKAGGLSWFATSETDDSRMEYHDVRIEMC